MDANRVQEIIQNLNSVDELTIGEVLALKDFLSLSDLEATAIFLGARTYENV